MMKMSNALKVVSRVWCRRAKRDERFLEALRVLGIRRPSYDRFVREADAKTVKRSQRETPIGLLPELAMI